MQISTIFILILVAGVQIGSVLQCLAKTPVSLADFTQQPRNNQPIRRQPTNTCGYDSCPTTVPNKLNVHIIAHTHDDVGWLKTVDQYYYGTKKHFSFVGVQFILDSLIPQLLMDPEKRFVYVEMSFFHKWWQEQDDQTKSIVSRLVEEGRLEFINGGWCMNDEATVSYHATIEQMTLGLKFLNETFGRCAHPKVGWQIDPFGHTNEQASLFAQFGFDGMYFTRIGYMDKKERTNTKTLDLIWHGDKVLDGQAGSIFTNIFRDGYDAPNGYCFDSYCFDDVIVDNKNSYEYNLDAKGRYMIDFIRKYAQSKLTNHLLIPFGGDFQYSSAGQNFKSLDRLIKYIRQNANDDIHIFYSTPSCYQKAIHMSLDDKRINLPEKYDDFMPYDSSSSVWWSGYFSSRPSVKLVDRDTGNLLPIVRMISLANLLRQGESGKAGSPNWINEVKDHEFKCLYPLWEILGDLQHHDAVTGTEKQHVANDYVRRASVAWDQCSKFIGNIRRTRFNELMKKSPRYEYLLRANSTLAINGTLKLDPIYLEDTMFCQLLNISQCDAMESEVDTRRYKLMTATSSLKAIAIETRNDKIVAKNDEKLAKELATKGVLVTAYNPLARPLQNVDIRLPCNGRCDLDKVQVIHVATNETAKVIRLLAPQGVINLPFRVARTEMEILFYANIPALGSTSFVISDDNQEELIDEEHSGDSVVITDERPQANKIETRSRRIRSQNEKIDDDDDGRYEYFSMMADGDSDGNSHSRARRELATQEDPADRVIVKFDLKTGMIGGLRRASDGSSLSINQKFGYYFPADLGSAPGAYIFRPNSSEPILLDKPISFRMYKRLNGALIEFHQKWADWIWQIIRVDAKKNYIEFDYVVGPLPLVESNKAHKFGREVITRYMTNMPNDGVFFTDSNARQLLPRHKLKTAEPEQLGGSFYPVVSTLLLRNNDRIRQNKSAEAVAVLVDRPQAGTSLNQGDLEFLIHRRLTQDDNFGVGEALDEPGEDGRGLVTRGRHRLFLRFQDKKDSDTDRGSSPTRSTRSRPTLIRLPRSARENLTFEEYRAKNYDPTRQIAPADTYLVQDELFNDLRIESVKFAMKPILTFDRLRISASEFIECLAADGGGSRFKADLSLLNNSLPINVNLLTLQPWNNKPNTLLLRLENLNNPLTLHPFPDHNVYLSLLNSYKSLGQQYVYENQDDPCLDKLKPRVGVDIEYLIKKIRIVSVDEMNLGANSKLRDDKRLNWVNATTEAHNNCDGGSKGTFIRLAPRQIRTFLVSFQYI